MTYWQHGRGKLDRCMYQRLDRATWPHAAPTELETARTGLDAHRVDGVALAVAYTAVYRETHPFTRVARRLKAGPGV